MFLIRKRDTHFRGLNSPIGWVVVVLLMAGCKAEGQKIDSLGLSRLSDALIEFQNSELMRNGTLAFCLKSTKSNQTILSLNKDLSLPSASTLKLVSTATVLSVLGGDYTYKTFLEHDGRIVNDTLFGNLYLRGTGDPSLGSGRFDGYPGYTELLSRWTKAVQKAGIRHIKGRVVADASYFDEQTLADTWVWGDLGNYYGAGVQGVNFNENMYRISFRAGRSVGDSTAVVKMDPELPFLKFTNRVTSGESGSGDQVYIYSNPLGTEILLTGTVPRGVSSFTVKGAVPNPAYATGYLLTRALNQALVGITEGADVQFASSLAPSPRTLLDQYTSPPLRALCQQTNWWSINLYADAFLKAVGKKLGTKPGYDDSVQEVATYWQSRGVDMRGFYAKDGSGLSPTGSLTVQNLSDVLSAATRTPSYDDFYASIAVLGQTGTVRNIGKKTTAAGNVRVKSGSIEGTRSYAGYLTTKEGEKLSFAVVAHKYLPDSSRTVGQELARLLVLLGDL